LILQLLLVPALGGYWLLTNIYIYKYRIFRESGYHLFLSVALCGTSLLVLARLCVVLFHGCVPARVVAAWMEYAPFDYSGTVAISAVLAITVPVVINFFTDEKKAAMKAAKISGDFIECALQEAIDERKLVELSTKSGKSYVGIATESGFDVRVDCDVILIPVMSGYRDKETRKVVFTTNYADLLSSWDGEWNEFQVVLPADDIASVRHFNPEAYEHFRAREQEGKAQTGS